MDPEASRMPWTASADSTRSEDHLPEEESFSSFSAPRRVLDPPLPDEAGLSVEPSADKECASKEPPLEEQPQATSKKTKKKKTPSAQSKQPRRNSKSRQSNLEPKMAPTASLPDASHQETVLPPALLAFAHSIDTVATEPHSNRKQSNTPGYKNSRERDTKPRPDPEATYCNKESDEALPPTEHREEPSGLSTTVEDQSSADAAAGNNRESLAVSPQTYPQEIAPGFLTRNVADYPYSSTMTQQRPGAVSVAGNRHYYVRGASSDYDLAEPNEEEEDNAMEEPSEPLPTADPEDGDVEAPLIIEAHAVDDRAMEEMQQERHRVQQELSHVQRERDEARQVLDDAAVAEIVPKPPRWKQVTRYLLCGTTGCFASELSNALLLGGLACVCLMVSVIAATIIALVLVTDTDSTNDGIVIPDNPTNETTTASPVTNSNMDTSMPTASPIRQTGIIVPTSAPFANPAVNNGTPPSFLVTNTPTAAEALLPSRTTNAPVTSPNTNPFIVNRNPTTSPVVLAPTTSSPTTLQDDNNTNGDDETASPTVNPTVGSSDNEEFEETAAPTTSSSFCLLNEFNTCVQGIQTFSSISCQSCFTRAADLLTRQTASCETDEHQNLFCDTFDDFCRNACSGNSCTTVAESHATCVVGCPIQCTGPTAAPTNVRPDLPSRPVSAPVGSSPVVGSPIVPPTMASRAPSVAPSYFLSIRPTGLPTVVPTGLRSIIPSDEPTDAPTFLPSSVPSTGPSEDPVLTLLTRNQLIDAVDQYLDQEGIGGRRRLQDLTQSPRTLLRRHHRRRRRLEESDLPDINTWDVSRVTDMQEVFYNGRYFRTEFFNQDISGWDTGAVTQMAGLFKSAAAFDQDISNWSVSNVENMAFMFYLASSFNQDISTWDVSKVNNFEGMFNEATAFSQNLCPWGTGDSSPALGNPPNMFINTACPRTAPPNFLMSIPGPLCFDCQ